MTNGLDDARIEIPPTGARERSPTVTVRRLVGTEERTAMRYGGPADTPRDDGQLPSSP